MHECAVNAVAVPSHCTAVYVVLFRKHPRKMYNTEVDVEIPSAVVIVGDQQYSPYSERAERASFNMQ
jgi:hypothetical protein